MKRKHLIISAFTIFALLGAGAGTALAYGGPGMGSGLGMIPNNFDPSAAADRFAKQIAYQAELLGVSADEIKSYWVQGKGVQDIIKDKGISETELQTKMKAARLAEQKEFLQALVDKGVITQAQADARLKITEEHMDKSDGKMMKMVGQGGKKFGNRK